MSKSMKKIFQWLSQIRVTVKCMPPQEFFDDLKECLGMSKKDFFSQAVNFGIGLQTARLISAIKFNKQRSEDIAKSGDGCHDENGGGFASKELPSEEDPLQAEKSEEDPLQAEKSEDKHVCSVTSRVPKGFFRIVNTPKNFFLRVDVKSGSRLYENGYRYWSLTHTPRNNKTFIVFSREDKSGFDAMKVNYCVSKNSRSRNFTIFHRRDLEKLSEFLGVRVEHAQLLRIVRSSLRKNGDLWIEIKPDRICF